MNSELICYSTKKNLKEPKNVTPGKPAPPHPFFAVSQRRFGDFKHQGLDWMLFEKEIYNILHWTPVLGTLVFPEILGMGGGE